MEDRLIELETKISYQEHLLQELNDVIASQQQQLDRLEKEMKRVREHLKGTGSQLARPEEEAPPPHY
ncbi:MAG TPA: SlyX family protein [Mariprofundaceae bacterium]|nr:SlyX family protein [Mariprofundaceae bacterium]